jgi:hypothetical protein
VSLQRSLQFASTAIDSQGHLTLNSTYVLNPFANASSSAQLLMLNPARSEIRICHGYRYRGTVVSACEHTWLTRDHLIVPVVMNHGQVNMRRSEPGTVR